MEDAFGYVMFAVVIVGGLVALVTFLGAGKLYEQIGKGGFYREGDDGRRRPLGGRVDIAERDEEIRQLLRARNLRHSQHGGEIVDVEEELARLTAPTIDAALREEIRELVVARNRRRARRGQEPLDIEAEIEREIRELGAG